MRVYQKGEKVRLQDESIATVVETHETPYMIPAGHQLGEARPTTEDGMQMAGHAWYKIRLADGSVVTVFDRDVRNPPKDAA